MGSLPKGLDLSTSLSGYHVDNIDWAVQVNNQLYSDCSSGNIYELYEKARTESLRDLLSDLMIQIRKNHTITMGNVRFTMGEIKSANSNFNVLPCSIVGVKLTPNKSNGTRISVDKITLVIDIQDTYTIGLYKSGDSTPIETVDITTGGNSMTPVDVNWSVNVEPGKDYYLLYDRKNGMPFNHEAYCPTCNGTSPGFWSDITSHGVCADDFMGIQVAHPDSHMYGLLIEGSLHCDYTSWLCNMNHDFWCLDPWGLQFAKAWQMLASVKFNTYLIGRPSIDVYTTVKKESIYGKISKAGKIIREMTTDLAVSFPVDMTDCLECGGQGSMITKLESYVLPMHGHNHN